MAVEKNENYTVMVIDDDVTIGNMLEEALTKAGYNVMRAYSGTEALMVLEKNRPDLVLLDLMLPGLSGEELLPKLSGLLTIIMSAKTDIDNKVKLLYDGASDYVTKPFVISELMARISALLRLSKSSAGKGGCVSDDESISAGDMVFKTSILTVSVNDREAVLTRTEAAVLKLLMQNEGRPIGKSTILDRIGLDTPDCTERSLKQHVSNLRKKLEILDGKDHIEAIYGIGFKFNA
ncbi:MAG: response regulator transcription factor [Lachnospiraceae bacterium]|nr:response regulator transcription factor [Lachnospiraceae bacterium]